MSHEASYTSCLNMNEVNIDLLGQAIKTAIEKLGGTLLKQGNSWIASRSGLYRNIVIFVSGNKLNFTFDNDNRSFAAKLKKEIEFQYKKLAIVLAFIKAGFEPNVNDVNEKIVVITGEK